MVLAEQTIFGRNKMNIGSFGGSELLFYGGIALMAAAVVIGTVTFVFLHISGKRLKTRLDAEYGKKRH